MGKRALMALTHSTGSVGTDPLVERAAVVGFRLVTNTTSTGQVVWQWRRGDEAGPEFLTERLARTWIAAFLGADPGPYPRLA